MCKEIIGKYKVEDLQVVSPDTGGVIRARSVAKTLGVKDLAIIDKEEKKLMSQKLLI